MGQTSQPLNRCGRFIDSLGGEKTGIEKRSQRRCSTAFFLLVMCAAHAAPPPPLSDPSCAGRDARRLPSRPARPPRKRAAA